MWTGWFVWLTQYQYAFELHVEVYKRETWLSTLHLQNIKEMANQSMEFLF